jgi:dUTP pyrophosphatase
MKVKKLTETAIIPTRGSTLSAGADLYADEDRIIYPGERVLIPTGIAIKAPDNTYIRIAPRSGLALHKGLDVLAGVVDADYTGQIMVILLNTSQESVDINKGDRIAQAIAEVITISNIEEVDNLDDTERSSGGFGSTGT